MKRIASCEQDASERSAGYVPSDQRRVKSHREHCRRFRACESNVPDQLFTAAEAARRLNVRTTTLYDWLGQSDHGLLRIRGMPFTIDYWQGGPRGHGRICLAGEEVERLRAAMRVVPQRFVPRRPIVRPSTYPGITVPLGRPAR